MALKKTLPAVIYERLKGSMQLHSMLINETNSKMPAALTRESFCVANLLSKSCRSLQQKIRSCRRAA
jgi:hypothetical protein